jgi:nucleoside-diphosphate-sugar epimerase
MEYTNRRIVVSGGAGFLGSHLCARLLGEGHEVLCVDNYFTGSRQNIRSLLKYDTFEVMRHDVTFPLYIEADEIYNLACPASPVHYQFDPVQTTKTSVHGAINMLGLAKRIKAKIFQASTSEVYGDPTVHPQPESYWGSVNPIGDRSCYDEGNVALKHFSSIITGSMLSGSRSLGYSILTDRTCILTMVEWYRILSYRRCKTNQLPCTEMALKPGHFAMLRI